MHIQSRLILSLYPSFHTDLYSGSFTGGWVAASLLRSPEHFWVFYQILIILWSVWSKFLFWFPIPPVLFPRLWRQFQVQKLQLISTSISSSTAFSVLWQDISIYLSIHFLSLWSAATAKSTRFIFFKLTLSLVFWRGLDDPFVSQNPWKFYGFYSLRRILVCTYAIC